MAINYTQTRNLAHAVVTISDGTGTPKTLVIPIDEGDLQWTQNPNPSIMVMNRATMSHRTVQPQVPVRGRMTIKFTEYKGKSFSGAAPSPLDAMLKQGNASSWVSTELCGPYCFDLTVDISNPCSGAGTGVDQAEKLVFADCCLLPQTIREAVDYNRIEVEFEAKITQPTSTRTGT